MFDQKFVSPILFLQVLLTVFFSPSLFLSMHPSIHPYIKTPLKTDMSVNSSSNSSIHPLLESCLGTRTGTIIFECIFISYILLLPLFISVIYVSCQRWGKQIMSHSDIFTLNIIVLELMGILVLCLYNYTNSTQRLLSQGNYIFTIIGTGETLFQLFTCIERYIAVVHPITYMALRQPIGIRIRNFSIGCAWLLCFAVFGLAMTTIYFKFIYTFFILFCSTVACYCTLSALCVAICSGPSKGSRNRKGVDQSKQRALQTLMVITGVLLLRFNCTCVFIVTYVLRLSRSVTCLVLFGTIWLSVPSCLILPLLFLHKAGKLPSCKNCVSPRI